MPKTHSQAYSGSSYLITQPLTKWAFCFGCSISLFVCVCVGESVRWSFGSAVTCYKANNLIVVKEKVVIAWEWPFWCCVCEVIIQKCCLFLFCSFVRSLFWAASDAMAVWANYKSQTIPVAGLHIRANISWARFCGLIAIGIYSGFSIMQRKLKACKRLKNKKKGQKRKNT